MTTVIGSSSSSNLLIDIFGPGDVAKGDEGGSEHKTRNEKEVRTVNDPDGKFYPCRVKGLFERTSDIFYCIATITAKQNQAKNKE